MANDAPKFSCLEPFSKPVDDFHWKEMVDSVLEFIAASRTTLKMLTERLHKHEKAMILEEKRTEDNDIRLRFYKECLKMELVPNLKNHNSKMIQNPSVEIQAVESTSTKEKVRKDIEPVKLDPAEEALREMKRRSKYLATLPRHRSRVREKINYIADCPFTEGSTIDRSLMSKKSRDVGYSNIYKHKTYSKGDSLSRYY